jgi:uncharacterized protein (DUF1800 family)
MTKAARKQAQIERLMWRAGFGARSEEIKRRSRAPLATTVNQLLKPKGRALRGRPMKVGGRKLQPAKEWGHDVMWWLDRAVRTRHPLVERMTLNWHDHFATSGEAINEPALMLRQYRTIRRHALGSFHQLARAIVRDGAMQLFLSLEGSSKEDPNENFAREFFELFTLGVNNGYTEHDVREASRAFTGFIYDEKRKRFGWDDENHDHGVKRILGRQGRFGPMDVVSIAVNHPNHAPFICTKLWNYFSPNPPPKALLRKMVRAYRRANFNVRPVLRLILTSPALYRRLDQPDMVKPPFVYLAGMMRQTRWRPDGKDHWAWMLFLMGQRPFHPPSVAGWDQNTAWISSHTTLARYQAANAVLGDRIEDGDIPQNESVEKALKRARKAVGDPRTSAMTKRAMRRYAKRVVRHPWSKEHYAAERQRGLRHMLLAGPDAQVC